MNENIGSYGMKWIEFMERNYPNLTCELKAENRLEEIACSVDEEAWEYRFLLDSQYAKAHPRPLDGFEDLTAWERTCQFYTDGAVMRERVLVLRTAA